jgi:hypothetical protein
MTIKELRSSSMTPADQVAYLLERVATNGVKASSSKRALAEIARLTGAPKPAKKTTPAKSSTPRPTGPGSRGGDPSKYLRGQIALAFGPYGSPAWVAAYKAAKGVHANNHTHAGQILASKVESVRKLVNA